jgi:hypothetical protein
MTIKLANNASGTLATAISASDTGLALTTGDGAEFPTLGAGDYFYATITSSGGTQEIVKATARVGDSLTVVRAQEGTAAAGFASGSRFELRVTAQSVEDLVVDYDTALRAALAAASGSTLVGFLQSGTGAVTRTAQNKLRESVSVLDFGAVGDGVADDTAAIQAAVDASKNLTVYFPPGQYRITSTIDMVKDSTAANARPAGFRGAGRGDPRVLGNKGTLLLWAGGASPMINMGGSRIVFEDFMVDGISTCTAFVQSRFFSGGGFAANTFYRVRVNNTSYFLVTDAASEEIQSDCVFEQCTIDGGISFLKVNNSFGVNYLLNFCGASNLTGPALHFVEGGYLVANLLSLRNVQCALKTEVISGDGSSGFFTINGLYWDGGTYYQGGMELDSGSVLINGGIVNNSGYTADRPFFDMNPSKARLTVKNFQIAQTFSTAFPILSITGESASINASATFENCQFGSVATSITDPLIFVNRGRYARVSAKACYAGLRPICYEPDGWTTFYNTADLSAVTVTYLNINPIATRLNFGTSGAIYVGMRFRVEAGTFTGADTLSLRVARESVGLGNATIITQTVNATDGQDQKFMFFRIDSLDDFQTGDSLRVFFAAASGVTTLAGLRISVDVFWQHA